ncbi:MAG: FHA domain-containing protein [Motiliproteus sp.]
MLKLKFKDNRQQPISITGSTLTIGQDESNDVALQEHGISDFHAEIRVEGDGLYLVDLLSGKGTYVNDQSVSKRHKLEAWDVIKISSVELEVVDPAKHRPSDWALKAELELLSGQFFPIQGTLLVGREQDCDLIINDQMLSRHHARLWLEDEGLNIEDLDSANGTFVNGQRIDRAEIQSGDEIRFDSAAFSVIGPKVLVQEDDNMTQLRPALDLDATLTQAPPLTIPSEPRPETAETAPVPKSITALDPAADASDGIHAAAAPPTGPDVEADFEATSIFKVATDSEKTQLMQSPPAFLLGESASIMNDRFALDIEPCLIGRSHGSNIQLLERSVSGRHAEIFQQGGGWAIRDMNSRNGTYLNDKRITTSALIDGDILRMGRVELRFDSGANKDPDTAVFELSKDGKSSTLGWVLGVTALVLVAGLLWLMQG